MNKVVIVLCGLALPLMQGVQGLGAGGGCGAGLADGRRLLTVGGTSCDVGLLCDSADSTCKLKEGGVCTAGPTAYCLSRASCVVPQEGGSTVCQCDTGYTPSENKTQCIQSGGAAVTIVSPALMATSYVVYQFFCGTSQLT